jgi:PAS domain S-box-containing protein
MQSGIGWDGTNIHLANHVLVGQDRVLELIARAAPIQDVLTMLAGMVEGQSQGICSILLLEQEKLSYGTAPNLQHRSADRSGFDVGIPFVAAADAFAFSTCRGDPVVVTDFLSDPRWKDQRELLARYGLRACWSTPFFSRRNEPLGSFSMYYTSPGMPGASEIDLIEAAARLAAIAVERWQGDMELRRAADNYRDLLANIHEIIFTLDVDGAVTYISPPIERLTGYSPAEMIGKPFGLFVHPQDHPLVQQNLVETLAGRPRPYEFRILDRAGAIHWCRSTSQPKFVGHRPVGLTSTIVDITEQRQTQQALREAEQKYRNIFEEAIVGIFRTTPDGRYMIVNPALAAMLGYDSPEEARNSVTDVSRELYVDPERRQEFMALVEKDGRVRSFECQIYRKNRSKMWVSVNARSVIENGRIVAYEGTNEDITERKLLQQQLLQSQRLDAIGQLAGGIAHDFNNLLGVVLGQGELLLERIPAQDPIRRRVDQICQAAHRAVSLTAQLLAFSRQQIMHPVVLDLDGVVRNLHDMMARLIGDDIGIVHRPGDRVGRVKGDVNQIEQVLLNLAVNARDAMPQGGTLTIETSNIDIDGIAQRHSGASPGQYVLLAVTDTGTGMDEGTMAQIFEPFFTTKDVSKGTGLGLATVYGIVKQSGGYISVSSEVGSGTTFSIYLPRTQEPLENIVPSEVPLAQEKSNGELILLVEDSGPLRSITREILDEAGYRVLEADSAEMALQLAEKGNLPLRLVITDVVMPKMNGPALAKKLLFTYPTLQVLYVSGYTDEAIFRYGLQPGRRDFLNKPCSRDVLLARVRELLDTAPESAVSKEKGAPYRNSP